MGMSTPPPPPPIPLAAKAAFAEQSSVRWTCSGQHGDVIIIGPGALLGGGTVRLGLPIVKSNVTAPVIEMFLKR